MSDVQQWSLYVDETGNFSEPGEPVSVVGLLHRGELDATLLERAIATAAPYFFHPYHSSIGNLPVSAVAGHLLGAQHDATTPELHAAILHLANLLHANAGEKQLAAFCSEVQQGRMPTFRALSDAHGWMLRNAAKRYKPLDQASKRRRVALQRLLHAVLEVIDTAYPDSAMVVAASGTVEIEKTEDVAVQVWRDTYLQLLETLLERVVAVLRSDNPSQTIRIETHIATRSIQSLAGRQVQLSAQHIESIARRARGFPLHERGSTISFVPSAHIVGFNSGVHAGVVLADVAANQLGRVFRDPKPRCWNDLVIDAAMPLRWPLQTHPLGLPTHLKILPTVAAPGRPRTAIQDAMRPAIPESPGDLLPDEWAREQARAWMEASNSLYGTRGVFGW